MHECTVRDAFICPELSYGKYFDNILLCMSNYVVTLKSKPGPELDNGNITTKLLAFYDEYNGYVP